MWETGSVGFVLRVESNFPYTIDGNVPCMQLFDVFGLERHTRIFEDNFLLLLVWDKTGLLSLFVASTSWYREVSFSYIELDCYAY